MRSTFRQGIARHQTDVNGNSVFLQRSGASGQFIDLIVSPQPTVLIFAHRAGTYLVEELKTVLGAWGPLVGPGTKHLYWDVNLLTGALTRGMTLHAPMYTSAAPAAPAVDQHWFDTVECVFRVWNGAKWVERLRVFAGSVTSNVLIHPLSVGSQAGLVGTFDAGNILLDSFGSPLRQSDGTFVTTTTWLNVLNVSALTARLDTVIMSAMALEELPRNSCVQLRPGRRMVLARSTDYTTRVAGLVTQDLYEGEVAPIITTGVVRDSSWSWPDAAVNRPLFCGPTGQLTLTPPGQGVSQQIGFVYDVDAILLNLQPVVVLDAPGLPPPPPPPPSGLPIAGFMADVTSGVAPLAVTFTSTSTDATSVEWDFINDGYVDATSPVASTTYSTPGVYTVRLRALNTFGHDDEIKPNLITVLPPSGGPTNVNLGMAFNAPIQVTGGQPFTFQVITTNDGLADATNVLRTLTLRSSNGTQVTVLSPPSGVSVNYAGPLTEMTLPVLDLASGGFTTLTLTVQPTATVTAVQIEGGATSPEVDANADDNVATITVGVRP